MKTLADHTLLYDEACPLCLWYTGAFIKHGFLDEGGRTQFGPQACAMAPTLDADRARHEIALVHRATGTVRYGIDSLFGILQHRWPVFTKLFAWRPFRAAIQQFYSFISYNRKVIAVDATPEAEQPCRPDFHLGYRFAYLLVAYLITAFTVGGYVSHLAPLVPPAGLWRELAINMGPLAVQGLLLWRKPLEVRMTYLGNMMTVALIGALLLLPVLIGAPVLETMGLDAGFYAGWLTAVLVLMTVLHWKRVKVLGLPWWLTATWLVYRAAVLLIII